MDERKRELLTYRIISGKLRCTTPYGTFHILNPTAEEKYISEEIYESTYGEAVMEGAYNEQTFDIFLQQKGIWSPMLEAKYSKLESDLENLKVALFTSYLNSEIRLKTKDAIAKTKREIIELYERLHSYDYVSADGIARLQKQKFLIAMSIYKDGKKLFNIDNYWMVDSNIIDVLSSELSKQRLQEEEVRLLARSEPWRSIWFCRKAGSSLFPCSTTEMTDEQRVLVYWSQVYDNIRESPKCPPDDVINDDDALDGWFIVQGKQHKQESDREWIENQITNPDIKNSGEIFIKTGKQDAARVYGVNDAIGRAKQRALFKKIEKEGVVEVMNQPDVVREKAEQLQRMYKERVTS